MKETPRGTSVGVDDPYEHAGRCDHLTDDGRCRFAFERFESDPRFAKDRRDDDYRCHIVSDPSVSEAPGTPEAEDSAEPRDPTEFDWQRCPHYQSTTDGKTCARCGLEERRRGTDETLPLLEEHHLTYREEEAGHELTVSLCRWCHAKIHNSWARIDDDVQPDPEAIAEREGRRSRELDELTFKPANDRRDD